VRTATAISSRHGTIHRSPRPAARTGPSCSADSPIGVPVGEHPALHGPARPAWTCTTCGDDWPCPTRRRQLTELCRGDPRLLLAYLAPYVADARTDLVDPGADGIAERFTGWCHHPPGSRVDEVGGGGADGGSAGPR
jgi:hypothetical protein